jgi:hypothetical protein
LLIIGIAFASIMIFWAYRHSDEDTRAQGNWILVGSLVGLSAYLLVYVMDNVEQFPFRLVDYDRDLLYLGPAVTAGAVVYAELRHHVMNIGFFFSMGLFYTALISLIVPALTFGANWARQFTYLAVLSAVCFQPFRKVVEQFVRKHLLKRRAARLRELRELTRTIGNARTLDAATSAFVTIACESLKLHGAAIVEAGRVVASAGRYETMNAGLIALVSDRALREELDDHDDAIRLPYERYGIKGQFRDSTYPRVAIIIDVPRTPYRIFVASPHSDGMDVDGDEVESLRAYARRATVALAFLAMREP